MVKERNDNMNNDVSKKLNEVLSEVDKNQLMNKLMQMDNAQIKKALSNFSQQDIENILKKLK